MLYNYVFKLISAKDNKQYRAVIKTNELIDKNDKEKLHQLLIDHGYNTENWKRFAILFIDPIY